MKNKKKVAVFLLLIVLVGISISTVSALDKNVEMKKNIDFLGNNGVNLTYSRIIDVENGEDLVIYIDSKKNEYFFKENDLVAFIKNENMTQDFKTMTDKFIVNNKIKVETYVNKVETYLRYFVIEKKTSYNDYELVDAEYLEATNEFSYIFLKKIDGYFVNDGIVISLDAYGNLLTYAGAHQGIYDNYKNINIDKLDVAEFVSKSMESSKNIDYKIDTQYINFVDNKLVLQIGIEILHDDGLYSTRTLYYEL